MASCCGITPRMTAPPDLKRTPWSRAVLVLALIASILMPACTEGRDGRAPDRNLLLITMDTTRADALGAYGAPEGVTPNLDRLAKRSLLFERAYATAPFTGPSHASILTSQHPSTHGVLYNGHRVDHSLGAGSVTLAEHLSGAGFATAAVVSAGPLAERYGFARGFESYQHVKQSGHGDNGGAGRYVAETAEQWLLRRPRDKPFFLWLHFFDPHLPYVNGRGIREALGVTVEGPVTEDSIRGLTSEEAEQCYRAEAFEMDRFIGRVLKPLELHDLLDDTVIAVVGDHGEFLLEHGLVGHEGLRDEVLHVPMLVHARDLDGTERRTGPVSTIDLLPTVLEMLGVPGLPTAEGRSLVSSEDRRDVAVFAEWRDHELITDDRVPQSGDVQISVQFGDSKLIRDVLFPDASLLFDLESDPEEVMNLLGKDDATARRLGTLLDAHLPGGPAGTDLLLLDAETIEMLRELGYLGGR